MSAHDTAYAKMSPKDKLAVARLKARETLPYLASALLALVPHEMPGLGTVGVTKDMLLLWDPEALNKWSLEEATFAMLHEVWHILRKHHERCELLGADKMLWNLAGDCEINDDLLQAMPNNPAKEHGVFPSTFQLDDGQLAESYYQKLRQKQQHMQSQAGEEGDGQPGGKPGPGWCGSGAGRELPNEPSSGKGSGAKDDKKDPTQGEGSAPTQGTLEGRSEADIERIRKQVAEAIQERASKGRGTLPGGWARWAEEQLKPPKIRWQDKLSRAARSAIAFRNGAVTWHYGKPSRRQGGIGYGPGRPVLPAYRAPLPDVDVWVDTSGSMGTAELTAALSEVKGVLLAVGSRVRFGACDAEVHAVKHVRTMEEILPLVKGGGGTDFHPVFRAAEEGKPKPSVLIFITDGCGPAPVEPPKDIKVIWLLVGTYQQQPATWGEVIKLDELPEAT